MVARDADAADVRVPPPLFYAVAIVGGMVLQSWGHALALPLPALARIGGTALLGAIGLLLVGSAVLAFKRTGQDPKPWKTTPEFIATGPYRWSRNPMYAGMGLLQSALAIGLSNGWMLALVPIVLGAVYVTAVRREEAYLAEKFGESYRTYKAAVRRWL